MARRIVFTDSGFWKYSWAHLAMSMPESCLWVMHCRLRARRPRASNKGLWPCSLRTEISQVSLNLLMNLLCTVDDEICKAFAIWRIPKSFYALFHRLESLCPSLLLSRGNDDFWSWMIKMSPRSAFGEISSYRATAHILPVTVLAPPYQYTLQCDMHSHQC